MTLTELRDEVYGVLGSDLFDPTDTATDGGRDTLDRFLNGGYRRVSTYRFPDGHQVRFRALVKVGYFQTFLYTSTAGFASATASTAVLDTNAGADDDRYNGFILEPTSGDADNERRVIVDYTGGSKTATIHKDWDTTPAAADTYKLYKRFNRLLPSSNDWQSDHVSLDPATEIFSILRLTDLEEKKRIGRIPSEDNFPTRMDQDTPPAAWWESGDRIEFDTPYSTQRWYMLEYVGYPEALTGDGTQVLAIPEPWHEAVMYAAIWRGQIRLEETDMARDALGNFKDTMISLRTEEEASYDYVEGQALVEKA